MKKLVSLILALCMLLSLSLAFADDADWTEDDFAAAADIRTDIGKDYTGKTVILHSNDVHGEIGGYALIAGLRDRFIEMGADTILVDCGDYTQGSVYVIATKGAAAVDLMSAAGYDFCCLGNHEFDFGYDNLMENLKSVNFTTLCANVTLDETGESILPGTKVWVGRSGLKLGFFGLETPETVTKVNPALISNISFTAFDNLYASAQSAVDELTDVDLVIGLLHLGVDEESRLNAYRSVDLLARVNGVDIVLDGHSHTAMTVGQNGELIQSTGTKFEYIGVVVIDNETKAVEDHFLVPTYLGNNLYDFKYVNNDVAEKAASIKAEIDAQYNMTFATTEVELNGAKAPGNRTEETNLGDLITDAIVWYVVKEGGMEQDEINHVVGITNGGGIRATIPVGEVTKKDINTVLPFGNTVAVAYVTGNELLEILEASTFCTPDSIGGYPQTSGIKWTLDTTKEFDKGDVYVLEGKETSYFAPASINRVSIQEVNGEPFDPEAVYAIVTNNFITSGGDTYNVLGTAENKFDTGITLDEAVMAYVEEVLDGKITAETYGEPQGRVTQIVAE